MFKNPDPNRFPWISLKTANAWRENFKKWRKNANSPMAQAEAFAWSAQEIQRLLDQPGAAGIRIYIGLRDPDGEEGLPPGQEKKALKETFFAVAVNADGKDILDSQAPLSTEGEVASFQKSGIDGNQALILNQPNICPPFCGGD